MTEKGPATALSVGHDAQDRQTRKHVGIRTECVPIRTSASTLVSWSACAFVSLGLVTFFPDFPPLLLSLPLLRAIRVKVSHCYSHPLPPTPPDSHSSLALRCSGNCEMISWVVAWGRQQNTQSTSFQSCSSCRVSAGKSCARQHQWIVLVLSFPPFLENGEQTPCHTLKSQNRASRREQAQEKERNCPDCCWVRRLFFRALSSTRYESTNHRQDLTRATITWSMPR